jgi:hypothetical protein
VEAYSVSVGGRTITLIDTPGFDDTWRNDVDVLREVSTWLTESYKSQRLLSGIIYLHPISSARMPGSARKTLEVFAKVVGEDAFHNIILVTTKWDLLQDPAVGVLREEQLRNEWWKDLIQQGSTTARSNGDRESALAIVKNIAFGRSTGDVVGVPLALQKQMVDEHKPLDETSAGQVLAQRIDKLEQSYNNQILELTRERNQEKAESKEERRLMQAEIDRLQREQHALHDEQSRLKSQSIDSKHDQMAVSRYLKPQLHIQIGVNEFLEADLPPPYSPRAPTRITASYIAATDLVVFSLSPMGDLYHFLRPIASKAFRPRLQKEYSRIEWTCVSEGLRFGYAKS